MDSLILFGFLNCPGTVKDKSKVLYEILQEGGPEKQPFITAADKDMKPTFSKLINLCTVELT